MNLLFLFLFLFIMAVNGQGWAGTGKESLFNRKEKNMNNDVQKILEFSKDPKELVWAAQKLASSPEQSDQEMLRHFLTMETFLSRLDSPEDYRGPSARLRIGRVLKTLSNNKAPGAQETLIRLTQDQTFLKNWARVDNLIWAVAAIRPAPPQVIKFWDDHCQPEDSFMHLTIQALVKNGSEPAMALLEKKIADLRFAEEDKLWWMRTAILSHRHDLPLLKSCERMLWQSLPTNLHLGLIESLFTYKPDEWYGADHYYSPPPLPEASLPVLNQLRKIGEMVLEKFSLPSPLKMEVQRRLEEINNLIKSK